MTQATDSEASSVNLDGGERPKFSVEMQRSSGMSEEAAKRRIVGRVYALLIRLAEQAAADAGTTATNQSPTSAGQAVEPSQADAPKGYRK